MSDRFETEILPVVQRYASTRFYDPEQRALVVELAWHAWRQSAKKDLPAGVWARWAVKHVLAGRDLPRVRGHKLDVFDRFVKWNGAGMEQVWDHRPGPVETVIGKELLETVLAKANAKQRQLILLVLEEYNFRTDQLAERLGVSSARVSQIRREIHKLAHES